MMLLLVSIELEVDFLDSRGYFSSMGPLSQISSDTSKSCFTSAHLTLPFRSYLLTKSALPRPPLPPYCWSSRIVASAPVRVPLKHRAPALRGCRKRKKTCMCFRAAEEKKFDCFFFFYCLFLSWVCILPSRSPPPTPKKTAILELKGETKVVDKLQKYSYI